MYTFDSRIRYSEIDRSGRLSIPAVVDYFQDCSAFWKEDQRNVKRSQLEHGDLDLTSFMQREILS